MPTSTPLHALTTLNDPTWVEAARILAQRMRRQNSDVASSVVAAYQRVLSREPGPEEKEALLEAYRRQLEIYSQDVEAAKQLLAVGAAPSEQGSEPAPMAALTAVCLGILNLDEALTRE